MSECGEPHLCLGHDLMAAAVLADLFALLALLLLLSLLVVDLVPLIVLLVLVLLSNHHSDANILINVVRVQALAIPCRTPVQLLVGPVANLLSQIDQQRKSLVLDLAQQGLDLALSLFIAQTVILQDDEHLIGSAAYNISWLDSANQIESKLVSNRPHKTKRAARNAYLVSNALLYKAQDNLVALASLLGLGPIQNSRRILKLFGQDTLALELVELEIFVLLADSLGLGLLV